MNEANYIYRGFSVLVLATAVILLYPFIHERFAFLEDNFRTYSFLDDIEVDSTRYLVNSDQLNSLTVSGDSLLAGQKGISLPKKKEVVDEFIHPHPQLGNFFRALHRAKKGKERVRIGYFGDSMIEGDLVTESLRNDLQKEFGGQGVGFVPVACPAPGYRKTIKHKFSKNWKYRTLLSRNPKTLPFSIAGSFAYLPKAYAHSAEDSWVEYKGSSKYEGTENFADVTLYYGRLEKKVVKKNQNWISISTDKGVDTIYLNKQELVNRISLSRNVTELKVNFNIDDQLPIYGLSFENQKGIYIDNFGVRGHSGLGMLNVQDDVWQQFNQYMHFDLVILHYGLNVIETERKNYKGYEKYFKKVVALIQKQLPKADILIVSVSDKSTKINGKMQTDPSVPKIVAAQRKVAKDMDVAFLDLYQGMGGKNTMIKWVKSNWASKDYTHVNRKGGKRIANVVKEYLMSEYAEGLPKKTKQLASSD